MAAPLTGINAIVPAASAKTVSPSDSVNFVSVTKALFVGTGGNIAVVLVGEGDSSKVTTFTNVLGGTILPVQATRVNSTSTTASNIVALY